jgi:hypothetical protein
MDPLWGSIYALFIAKHNLPYKYLDEMLRISKIWVSELLPGAPIVFIPNAH